MIIRNLYKYIYNFIINWLYFINANDKLNNTFIFLILFKNNLYYLKIYNLLNYKWLLYLHLFFPRVLSFYILNEFSYEILFIITLLFQIINIYKK